MKEKKYDIEEQVIGSNVNIISYANCIETH